MNKTLIEETKQVGIESAIDAVYGLMLLTVRESSLYPLIEEIRGSIGGGKMLRARLCLRLGAACGTKHDTVVRSAAAIEMVHAASLLHDDIIDEAYLRRGSPTFWAKKGISGAILLGDLLVCKAMLILSGKDETRQGGLLVRLAGEMCDAEAEQELITSGTVIDLKKCADIARRKTGSLFAFAAAAGASEDGGKADAILEAGYRIGTAYQLADDLMDASGDTVRDGKDLGKDAIRGTAISGLNSEKTSEEAKALIRDLCSSSSDMLSPWPEVKLAFDEYLRTDFAPVVSRFTS